MRLEPDGIRIYKKHLSTVRIFSLLEKGAKGSGYPRTGVSAPGLVKITIDWVRKYLWKPTRDQRQNLPSLLVRTSSGSRPVRSADFSGCPPEVRGQKRTNAQGLNTWRVGATRADGYGLRV